MTEPEMIQLALWVGGAFAFGLFLAAAALASNSKHRE